MPIPTDIAKTGAPQTVPNTTTELPDILVVIVNHNYNPNALRWKSLMSPHFPTVILDSGSNPPCPSATNYDNIYYGGLFNEAMGLAKNHKWICLITSDVQINDSNSAKLIERMSHIALQPNVGTYQPSCDKNGRSHPPGYNAGTGNYREVPFMEGWFQMFRTELGFTVDLELNRLGWGTDLYLCKRAHNRGMRNIVDDAVVVLHPHGEGYSFDEAKAQMAKWVATLPDWENKIKTGMAINIFEGAEHVREILLEVRDLVDVVVILLQRESYTGIPIDMEDLRLVLELRECGLVNEIIEFQRIPYLPSREQETVKRNQGMAYMQSKGCDYGIVMDSDEYYEHDQFLAAKEFVRQNLVEATYCYYINYYKDRWHVLEDDCYEATRGVPFLCKTSLRFLHEMPISIPTDATRRIQSKQATLLPKEMITMHHWSWVRNDVAKKINAWSSRAWFSNEDFSEMRKDWEAYDGTQETVTVPHKLKKNKIRVTDIRQIVKNT